MGSRLASGGNPGGEDSPALHESHTSYNTKLGRIAATTLRVGLAIGSLAAACAWANEPLAESHAITTTVVETDFATAPLELRPTVNDWSSLELGLPGSYYTKNDGKYGMSARVTSMPQYGGGQITDLLSRDFLRVASGVVSNPDKTIASYSKLLKTEVKQNGQEALLTRSLFTFGGGILVGGAMLFAAGKERRHGLTKHPNKSAIALLLINASLGSSVNQATEYFAVEQISSWASHSPAPNVNELYPIKLPKDMAARRVYANEPALQFATNEAVPFWDKNKARTSKEYRAYDIAASKQLVEGFAKVSGPREGEYVTIDIADPQFMKEGVIRTRQFIQLYVEKYGAENIKAITIAGDLAQLGSAGENSYIDELLTLGQDETGRQVIPVVVVGGDHESKQNIDHAQDIGVLNPDLQTVSIGNHTVTGANDVITKTFGIPSVTDVITVEHELGQQVRESLGAERVNQVILHEPYALSGLLGIEKMSRPEIVEFLEDDSNLTIYREDGIPNVPAASVELGHWHERIGPRVVWNLDTVTDEVTWSYISVLDDAGGSSPTPSISNLPIPDAPPTEPYGIQVTYWGQSSGLVTGIAPQQFTPAPSYTPGERIEIGLPGGKPLTLDQILARKLTRSINPN